jgi:hypothetical protein
LRGGAVARGEIDVTGVGVAVEHVEAVAPVIGERAVDGESI